MSFSKVTLVQLTHEELMQFGEECGKRAIEAYRKEIEYNTPLTIRQASDLSRKSVSTIYNWIENGSLRATLVDGKQYEVKKGDLLKRINRT